MPDGPVIPEGLPMRYAPYEHQLKEFLSHREDAGRALLWQMRTGKTKQIIDTVCWRYLIKKDIDALVVVAPNGVHVNWIRRELPAHGWEPCNVRGLAWVSAERRKKAAALEQRFEALLRPHPGLRVLAVNSESLIVPHVQEALKRFMRGRRVFLVFDESHDFGSPASKRTREAKRIRLQPEVVAVRILSGTADGGKPLKLYTQFELLRVGALGHKSWSEFRAAYANFIQTRVGNRRVEILDRKTPYKNLDRLQARIAPWSSVVLRSDVKGMPSLVRTVRYAPMSEHVTDMYAQLAEMMYLELASGGEVEANGGGAKITKLQQMARGWVVRTDGGIEDLYQTLDENPAIIALREQVHGLYAPRDEEHEPDQSWRPAKGRTGQFVVWCKYREDVRRAVAALRADGLRIVEFHGGCTQGERQQALDNFQAGRVDGMVGTPRTAGMGLNLSRADTVLWYSHTFDAIERSQANERATAVGGHPVDLVDIVAPGSVDEYILRVTEQQKRSITDMLSGQGLKARLMEMLAEQLAAIQEL